MFNRWRYLFIAFSLITVTGVDADLPATDVRHCVEQEAFLPIGIEEGSVDLFSSLSKRRMIGDLEIIKNTFEIKYAPAGWKKSFSGWNLDEELAAATKKVMDAENLSIKGFHSIVKSFLLSAKDYHVSAYFYTTEFSYLPFKVKGVAGRYFVSSVNTNSPTYARLPLAVGDEIVSFDGRSCHDAVLDIKTRELGNNSPKTDQSLAEGFLTIRLGVVGHTVPQGNITIGVLHKGTNDIVSYKVSWEYHPEKIKKEVSLNDPEGCFDNWYADTSLSEHPFFKKTMSTPLADALYEAYSQINCCAQNSLGIEPKGIPPEVFGSSFDALPQGNTIIFQPATYYFKAYVYQTPNNQKIGYIRLPTFHSGSVQAKEFAYLVSTFQGMTDALIIDQTNNPGGYFFYMYALASLLTDKPLKTTTQRQTITQEEVSFALKYLSQLENVKSTADAQNVLGTNLQGLPVDYNLAKAFIRHFRFLIDEWEAGRNFTEPSYLYSIAEIKPNPGAKYTKPILLLVNSLDFSCADFFPAMLQDNKRAVIMGERTAGAGGFVLRDSYPNLFGVASYSYTGSIAEREDKMPIENLGVTPDVPYEITVNDLQNNYYDYHQAIQKVIDSLLAPK